MVHNKQLGLLDNFHWAVTAFALSHALMSGAIGFHAGVVCMLAIAGCSYFSGGIFSAVIPWYATCPVTAILLLGFNRNTVL